MDPNKREPELHLGIALGGGAALGAAHIGVLKAFEEAKIRFDCLAGTSIGSLIAALYAFDVALDEIQGIMEELNWLDVTNLNPSTLGLLSNDKLGDVVQELIGEVTFEDAPLPMAFVATDISTGEKVVLNSGPIDLAIMASCALPGLFTPIALGDHLLVDGGLVENVPVNTLCTMDVKTTIGVDLAAKTVLRSPSTLVDVIINMTYILLESARSNELDQADFNIVPDTSTFNFIDTNQVAALVQTGYDAALPIVEAVHQ